MQNCAIHQLVAFAVHTYIYDTLVNGKGWIDNLQTLRMFQNLLKFGIQTATNKDVICFCTWSFLENVELECTQINEKQAQQCCFHCILFDVYIVFLLRINSISALYERC